MRMMTTATPGSPGFAHHPAEMQQGNLVHRGGGGAPRQHPQQLHQKLKLWRRTVAALPAAQSSQVAAVTTAREESSWKPGDAAVARRKAAPSSAEQRSVRHNGINPLTCTCVRPLPALCARAHTHTHTHTHTAYRLQQLQSLAPHSAYCTCPTMRPQESRPAIEDVAVMTKSQLMRRNKVRVRTRTPATAAALAAAAPLLRIGDCSRVLAVCGSCLYQ
jgi:hypothetical protein